METSLEIVEGMQFDRGYLSPYFVTDAERMEVAFDDAYVLLCEQKLSGMRICCRCSSRSPRPASPSS